MIAGIDKYFNDITVQRSTTTTDAWGNTIQSWATHLTVKGLIRQLSGSQPSISQNDIAISSHRMYCRVVDITTNDRVVYGGKYYDVVRVNNVMNFGELLQVDLDVIG